MEKKDLTPKPNQLIEIKGAVSGVQTKMYNVILGRAHQELKKGDKEHFEFLLEDIKNSSGVTDKNDSRIRKYLKDLKDISIEYKDKKGDWGGFNLISEYKKTGDKIRISLPQSIREALILNNYYTTIDLLIMKSLQGKHSVVLYEIALKYHKAKIPQMEISYFRELTNTHEKNSYDDFQKLRTKVIEPSIKEINEKTDINLKYSVKKTGRKVTHIKFEVRRKKGNPLLEVEPSLEKTSTIEIKQAISKAKKNIYISKAWNGRVDNKITKVKEEEGERFVVNLLKELYKVNKEVKTTLVQYINGMVKQIKEDEKADKEDQKKRRSIKTRTKEPKEIEKELLEEKQEPKKENLEEYKKRITELAKDQLGPIRGGHIGDIIKSKETIEEVEEVVREFSINLKLNI